ncbi:MAG TPA: hypothetical protein VK972_05820, partial [Wenzhouxiangella sp.]|nr:hypothetical protein [Wenzhouxiangella sp.]
MVESLRQPSLVRPAVLELGLRGRHMARHAPTDAGAPTGVGALRRMATRETRPRQISACASARKTAARKLQGGI